MALVFLDGFDKYGPANSSGGWVSALLGQEYTTSAGSSIIVAGLSASGRALNLVNICSVTRSLGANYSRLIGGIRFSATLAAGSNITFNDGGTAQASITINTTGTISVRNGAGTGTVLASSTATVLANTTHYLEWDITFANAGSYRVWLDGIEVIPTGSGDTTGSANAYATALVINGTSTNTNFTVDDLYVFDATGSANNAALLTSPRVETSLPSADSSVQFTLGAATIGNPAQLVGGSVSAAANQFRVRAVVPAVNCTLNSISFQAGAAASGTVNLRPVVYADSAGAPGSLMSTGATATATSVFGFKTMALTTPQALTAGTQYWIGCMNDIAVTNGLAALDGASNDRVATSTFSSGAPGTAPATSATTSVVIWGNVSATGANWYEVGQATPNPTYSYILGGTAGFEDLYTFPNLAQTPTTVHAVAVKALCARSDTGARTVSMRVLSGGTDSGGSLTGQTPGTSYTWLTSLFPLDPATGAAWLPNAVNLAKAGFKIDA